MGNFGHYTGKLQINIFLEVQKSTKVCIKLFEINEE